MKAISLWQPWASAIARGSKRIETRSWSTPYRGPLAIHASKRLIKRDMDWCARQDYLCAAMGLDPWVDASYQRLLALPRGCIVALCDLVDCVPTECISSEDLDQVLSSPNGGKVDPNALVWSERMMGDFTPGRFGWVLDNISALPAPVPCRGYQGLFDTIEFLNPGVRQLVQGIPTTGFESAGLKEVLR